MLTRGTATHRNHTHTHTPALNLRLPVERSRIYCRSAPKLPPHDAALPPEVDDPEDANKEEEEARPSAEDSEEPTVCRQMVLLVRELVHHVHRIARPVELRTLGLTASGLVADLNERVVSVELVACRAPRIVDQVPHEVRQ